MFAVIPGNKTKFLAITVLFSSALSLSAQSQEPGHDQELLDRIDRLEKQVSDLQGKLDEVLQRNDSNRAAGTPAAATPSDSPAPAPSSAPAALPAPASSHSSAQTPPQAPPA